MCNNYEVEDARHFVLRCPAYELERDAPFEEISVIPDGTGIFLIENSNDFLSRMLGKTK